ncbi:hypothetical protein TNIN_26261 [Trichonephila inaurata madagascariensis]|uniref:Uncharacterized protein n=1 Tax=Trichonephila inaurata madagascariensis TaxID=2747483 RepID=A0A8X6X919_9ARAC|nr:hypothetical protein TNIN_26261 [Trichonephila inaurata madagascariensis]
MDCFLKEINSQLRILGLSTFPYTAAFDVITVKGKEPNANEAVHFKVDFPTSLDWHLCVIESNTSVTFL